MATRVASTKVYLFPRCRGSGDFGLSPAESRREEQPQKAAPAEAGGDDRGLDRVAAQKGHPRSCIHHAHLGMDLVKR